MKNKDLFFAFGIFFLVLTLSFVSADYKFQNDSGINLGVLSSINGNLSILGNVSVQNFIGSGEFLTDLNIDPSQVNYWNKSGSDLYYNSGSVGIGTSSPAESLEIVGSINLSNQKLSVNSISFGGESAAGLNFSTSNGEIIFTPLSSTWAYFYTSSDNFIFNKGIYTTANKFSSYDSGDLELQTGGNTRMLIDSATGQVGINTTNPQNTLNVVGNGNFTGELYANGNRIDNLNSTGLIANWSEIIDLSDYVPYIGGDSNLNLSGQNISADYFIADGSFLTGISGGSVWDTSGSDIYYNDGNVGINTSSPETTLNVNGDVLIGLAGKIILSHASSSDDDWSIGAEGENLLVREKDDSNKFYMGIYDDANISLGVGGTTLTVTDTEIQIDNTIRFFDPIGTGTDDALLVAYVNNVQGSEYPCAWNEMIGCYDGSAPSYPSASCGASYIDPTIISSEGYSDPAGISGCVDYNTMFQCLGGSSGRYVYTRTYCKGWKAG